jgi:DUF4097 and DUF4098 domain-containing protein YvlB
MKTHHLLLAVAALSLLPGTLLAERASTLREQSQQVVEARGLTGLRVENPSGLIQVGPSRDGRIHLSALKIANSRMSAQAQEFARGTRVETSTESGRFVVRVRYPQRQKLHASLSQLFRGEFDLPRIEVRLSFEVPPNLPVDLETASGDLETSGLAGPQSLQTTSGDIEVHAAAGFLSISTTSGNVMASKLGRAQVRSVSGDVTLDVVRGPLDIRTTSGDINLSGVTDGLALSSVSGDIEVDRAPRGLDAGTTSGGILVDGLAGGLVRLRSTSGEVRVGLDRSLSRADVNTVSGGITLRLADGLGCDLTLKSTSGTLDSSVPLKIRTVSRREMSGAVSGGGPPVVVNSLSGDIAVTGGGR